MRTTPPAVTRKHASLTLWVHGQSVVPFDDAIDADDASRRPGTAYLLGRKEGWGSAFPLDPAYSAERWFQIPIPTPISIDSVALYLDEITILFRTDWESAGIAQLDLWDGPNKPGVTNKFESLLSGDHTAPNRTPGKGNRWRPRLAQSKPLQIKYALNVSVLVKCTQKSSIVFCAAGADFVSE